MMVGRERQFIGIINMKLFLAATMFNCAKFGPIQPSSGSLNNTVA
jgi:hypothetical protein